MEVFASTTRTKRADPIAKMKEAVKEYTDDRQALLCIMPKKKAPATLLICVGKFTTEGDGRVLWMPHTKQAFFGNAEATDSSLEELAMDGPTIPLLLSDLAMDLRQWVQQNAINMHDWYTIGANHEWHDALRAHYHDGGSLDALAKAVAVEERPAKAKPAAKAVTVKLDAAEEEPQRGRSLARVSKREPSSSPAAVKPPPKKPASPSKGKEEEAEPATPAARRSSRLAKAAETPSEAMKELSM